MKYFMGKYLYAGLVFLYVVLTMLCFLLVLLFSGVRLSGMTLFLAMAGWTLFCFSSAWFTTGIYIFFRYRLRLPLSAERVKLACAFSAVAERASYKGAIKLRIEESDEWDAFAVGVRTIAVSKGLLEGLTEEELKGVLAHELGHLMSYDTLAISAYLTAGYLPSMMNLVFRWGLRVIGALFGPRERIRVNGKVLEIEQPGLWPGCLGFVVFCGLLCLLTFTQTLITVVILVPLFSVLNRVFRWSNLFLSRLVEYRQDAFAQKLGYGKGLRDALEKLTRQGEQAVNIYHILFHSTHPVIYNRILRLEKLEGL
jgi:heat shock protein HtpX